MGWLHKPRKPSTWGDFSMKPSTNSPSHFSHRQQRVTEQHPLKHSTDSLHWRRRKRALPAPEHPCGFSLCFALPSCHNKSTLRAFITQSLSCDSSPRDTVQMRSFAQCRITCFVCVCVCVCERERGSHHSGVSCLNRSLCANTHELHHSVCHATVPLSGLN